MLHVKLASLLCVFRARDDGSESGQEQVVRPPCGRLCGWRQSVWESSRLPSHQCQLSEYTWSEGNAREARTGSTNGSGNLL